MSLDSGKRFRMQARVFARVMKGVDPETLNDVIVAEHDNLAYTADSDRGAHLGFISMLATREGEAMREKESVVVPKRYADSPFHQQLFAHLASSPNRGKAGDRQKAA